MACKIIFSVYFSFIISLYCVKYNFYAVDVTKLLFNSSVPLNQTINVKNKPHFSALHGYVSIFKPMFKIRTVDNVYNHDFLI